jgi:YgiT-type zinc finger domain-containing protein
MKCVICKRGETAPGFTTVTLTRDDAVLVFKSVPADICQNCGEYYLSDEVTGILLNRAEVAINNGSEVEIQRYAA